MSTHRIVDTTERTLANTNAEVLYDLNHAETTREVFKQTWWWLATTAIVVMFTIVPSVIMTITMDRIEFAEALLISLGVHSIAGLTELLIHRMFSVINESGLSYYIRGVQFFMDENPLEQYLTERKLRHGAREAGVQKRRGQMASYPLVWFVLILCSFTVRVAPDVLGAGLISQTIPFRVITAIYTDSSTEDNPLFNAPDFGYLSQDDMFLRGNCMWSRGGIEDRIDSYGFVIWQYCIDIHTEKLNADIPSRTLNGSLNGEQIYATFHIEAITKDIFSEAWEPFSNKMHSQLMFERLLGERNECMDEKCVNEYRSPESILTYRLLKAVGVIERPLENDKHARTKLLEATGQVKQRLTTSARAAFIVLVVTVKLFALLQAVSQGEESRTIKLARAVGELRGTPRTCFETAVSITHGYEHVSKHWSARQDCACFLIWNEDDEVSADEVLDRAPEGFIPIRNKEGDLVFSVSGRNKVICGTTDCAHFGYTGQSSSVSGLVAGACC